eukprot:gene3244-3725_t
MADSQGSESGPIAGTDSAPMEAINYKEASELSRKSSKEELWAIVKKMSDKNAIPLEPTKDRKGWRTIRIFVSSTFKDFHQEREVLVKEVFPDLRIWCEERKLKLVECDLRWGVPKDTPSEETIKICLEELDRCYEDNVAPFFLNLAGERSGWVPSFDDLSHNVAIQYGWVYGLSITEMEIVHGAIRKLNPNALFMMRKPIKGLPDDVKKDFCDTDPLQIEKINTLKNIIKSTFPETHVHSYDVESVVQHDDAIAFSGLRGSDCFFSQTVYDFFQKRIECLYPLDPRPEDVLQVQREAHETFIESRSRCVLGRDQLIKQIHEYFTCESTAAPLLVVGTAGSGKSALMAKCATDAVTWAKNHPAPLDSQRWKVFFHFVGATPGSTDLAFFLRRLTKEIKPDLDNVVNDLESLIQLTAGLLSNADTEPVILFIDAFDEDKQQFLRRWLPETLPAHVKVIVSTIEGSRTHSMLRAYETIPTEITCGPLDRDSREEIIKNILSQYNKRLHIDQMVTLLDKEGSSNPLWLTLACEELRVFGSFEKLQEKIHSLPDDLISLEMDVFSRFEKGAGGQLMVATLCLLEVSRHGLLEIELLALLADERNTKPRVFVGVEEETIMAEIKVQMEESDNEDYANELFGDESEGVDVEDTGKSKDEADGIKPKNKRKKGKQIKFLPAREWAIIYRNLKSLLRPCGDLGEGRLDFYHRSLSKAVRKKYFDGTDEYKTHVSNFWHGVLAGYFEGVDDMDRKAEELPYHLELLKNNDRLVKCLTEWPVFDRLYSQDFNIDLLHFWSKVGKYSIASAMYVDSCKALRDSGLDLSIYGDQVEKVINFLIRAGQYDDAYKLLEERRKIEEEHLGSRPDKVAEIYHLMAKSKSECVTNYEFSSVEQLDEHKEVVEFCRKSLEARKQLSGDKNEFEAAKMNILISFHLCNIAHLVLKEGQDYREKEQETEEKEQENRGKEQECRRRQEQCREKEQECRDKQQECRDKQQTTRKKEQEVREKEKECREKEQEYREKETEYREKETEYREEEQVYREKQQGCQEKEQEHREKEKECREKGQEYQEMEQEYRSKEQECRDEELECLKVEQEYREKQQECRDKEQQYRDSEKQYREIQQEYREKQQECRQEEQECREKGREYREKEQECQEKEQEYRKEEKECWETEQEFREIEQEFRDKQQVYQKKGLQCRIQEKEYEEKEQECREKQQECREMQKMYQEKQQASQEGKEETCVQAECVQYRKEEQEYRRQQQEYRKQEQDYREKEQVYREKEQTSRDREQECRKQEQQNRENEKENRDEESEYRKMEHECRGKEQEYRKNEQEWRMEEEECRQKEEVNREKEQKYRENEEDYRVKEEKNREQEQKYREQENLYRDEEHEYRKQEHGYRGLEQEHREKEQKCRKTEQECREKEQESREQEQECRKREQEYRKMEDKCRSNEQESRETEQECREKEQVWREIEENNREKEDASRTQEQEWRGNEQECRENEQECRKKEQECREKEQEYRMLSLPCFDDGDEIVVEKLTRYEYRNVAACDEYRGDTTQDDKMWLEEKEYLSSSQSLRNRDETSASYMKSSSSHLDADLSLPERQEQRQLESMMRTKRSQLRAHADASLTDVMRKERNIQYDEDEDDVTAMEPEEDVENVEITCVKGTSGTDDPEELQVCREKEKEHREKEQYYREQEQMYREKGQACREEERKYRQLEQEYRDKEQEYREKEKGCRKKEKEYRQIEQECREKEQEFRRKEQEYRRKEQECREKEQEYRDKEQEYRDKEQEYRDKEQECRNKEQEYREKEQEYRKKEQEYREQEQEYRQMEQEYRDKEQECRLLEQEYRDKEQECREEEQTFREMEEEFRRKEQEYRDKEQEYRDIEQEYREKEQEYREKEQEYRDEEQMCREEEQRYREEEQDYRKQEQEFREQEQVFRDKEQECREARQQFREKEQECRGQEQEYRIEAFACVDSGIAILDKVGDIGNLAVLTMTKALVYPRTVQFFEDKEQLFLKALDMCKKAYGENNFLACRLYQNIGILHEDNERFEDAYDNFVTWDKCCSQLLGTDHPKSQLAKKTLAEAKYTRIREEREKVTAGTA